MKERNIRDNLPTVGTVVEYDDCGKWIQVRVLAHHPDGNSVWHEPVSGVYQDGRSYSTDGPEAFRTFMTDEEKFVKGVIKVLTNNGWISISDATVRAAKHLFNSGLFEYKGE